MTNTAIKPGVVKAAPAPRKFQVTRGKLRVPYKVLCYGPEGVGKSTFAAGAPSPIWLPIDNRTAHLDIARLPTPATWDDALESLRALEGPEFAEFATVVIDPINWLEQHVGLRVTGSPDMPLDKWEGGYGRGQSAAFEHWRVFRQGLDRLWSAGKNIVLLAHSKVKGFNDPLGPGYDRYILAMNDNAAGLFRQWVDFVLFAQHEDIAKVDSSTKKFRGVSTGMRLVHTEHCAGYDAKFTGRSPGDLPLSWEAFDAAAKRAQSEVEEIRTAIRETAASTGDAAIVTKAETLIGESKDNVDRLAEVLNALRVKVESSKQASDTTKGE